MADLGSQILVQYLLKRSFPHDGMIAEEDCGSLNRLDETRLALLCRYIQKALGPTEEPITREHVSKTHETGLFLSISVAMDRLANESMWECGEVNSCPF